MYRPHTVRDGVTFFSTPAQLRAPAFRVIDRMSSVHPSHQLLGAAVAVVAMCEACGYSMRDLIRTAENVMKDVDSCNVEHIKAIRDYALNELPRNTRR